MTNIETNIAYEFGPFRLNPAERQFLRSGISVAIPPKAFEILVLLVKHSGRLCKKQDLMEAVWPGIFVEENNLAQLVSLLRKLLGTKENDDSFIETVPKLGYRFVGEVRELISNSQPNVTAFAPDRESMTVASQEEKAAPQEDLPAMVPPEGFPANPTASPSKIAIPQSGFARFSKRRIIYLLAAVLCLGIAIFLVAFRRPPAPLRVLGIQPLLVNAEPSSTHYIDTDRDRIYLLVSSQGRSQLAEMSDTGGEPLLLPEFPSGFRPLSLAPDGHRLLALAEKDGIAEQGLWIVPLPAGSPWKVGNLKSHAAGWSPDGATIVFAYENGLYTAKDDGSSQRELVSLPGPAQNPCWSPDGKWIRFMMQTDFESYSLLEVAAEGKNLQPRMLLNDPGLTSLDGRWTADGNYFVFPMRRNGLLDLWALPKSSAFYPATGRDPIQLTRGQLDLVSPVPSRDGKRIFAIGTVQRNEILRHDPGSNSLMPFLPGISADSLAFSRDGQWVVYSRYPERTLWRSRTDGSKHLQLTFSPLEAILPQWSPDSKTIAFAARKSGTPWKIYTIPVEGGRSQPLSLIESKEQQATPAWSPDGSVLCFAGAPWETAFTEESSTAVQCLDRHTNQLSTLPQSAGLWSPRWSPDGQYMVAETVDSQELKLFDFHTRQWRLLPGIPNGIVEYTAWSKDSRFIYFNVYGEKGDAIYRVAVAGKGAKELVLDLKNLPHAETLGHWFTLDPADAPLLLRDTSFRKIYVLDMQ